MVSTQIPRPGQVHAVKLTGFRNYTALEVSDLRTLVVLTGPNGSGKTNFLEAISLLTPGRGLRRASYGDLKCHGGGDGDAGWAVNARCGFDGEEVVIGTGTHGMGDGSRGRAVRINGAAAPAESLLGYLRILWLTPAMDRLFTGPAGDRRRFLDRLVMALDPVHARRVSSMERLLAGRNRLLEETRDQAWLDAQEAELAPIAWEVSAARSKTISALQDHGSRSGGINSDFPASDLVLAGGFEDLITDLDRDEACGRYVEALRHHRNRDRAAGRTLLGPNRSDLRVGYAPKRMPAAKSSTGEQKALLVGLILAHARLVGTRSGIKPIVLLDEIAAHLDENRRGALFRQLEVLGSQCFLTGTDRQLFAAGSEFQHFEVQEGNLRAV